jgi:hypothetical protein
MAHLLEGSEHRWGERVRVDIPVRVLGGGGDAAHCHLKNLILSGALVKPDHDLILPLPIDVYIERPFQLAMACVVKARVSRKDTHGVGIEWCEFSPPFVNGLLRPRRYMRQSNYSRASRVNRGTILTRAGWNMVSNSGGDER